jgi:hypothetical protein
VSLITVLPATPVDTLELIKGWQLNLHRVPPVVQQELDGTMHLHDVDVWMWLQKATPKKSPSVFRKGVWALFQQPSRWFELTSDQRVPSPIRDIFHASITEVYDWGDCHPRDHSKKELAQWLRQHGGINISHAALLKIFAERLVSSLAYNHPAMQGKRKWEALGASTATQGAAKRSLAEHIQHQQLDHNLDKVMAAAVASSDTIVVDDPTFPDKVEESHPFPLHMIKMIIWTLTLWSSSTRSCMAT